MFYCNQCGRENGWPINALKQSQGPCECCDVMAVCNDVPSSLLAAKADRNAERRDGEARLGPKDESGGAVGICPTSVATPTNDERVELKGCPFCGSDNLDRSSNGDGNEWVNCENCGAEGPMAKLRQGEKPETLWNTRLSTIPNVDEMAKAAFKEGWESGGCDIDDEWFDAEWAASETFAALNQQKAEL